MFAIKAEVSDAGVKTFAFPAQKTMYGGKLIAKGDEIFVFASENEGGPGLIASGVVTSAEAVARKPGVARQTPRVSIAVRRTARTKRRLGRSELRPFSRLEGRTTGDGTELQVLSPGDEQDRRDLGGNGGVSARVFLTRRPIGRVGGCVRKPNASDSRFVASRERPRMGRASAHRRNRAGTDQAPPGGVGGVLVRAAAQEKSSGNYRAEKEDCFHGRVPFCGSGQHAVLPVISLPGTSPESNHKQLKASALAAGRDSKARRRCREGMSMVTKTMPIYPLRQRIATSSALTR